MAHSRVLRELPWHSCWKPADEEAFVDLPQEPCWAGFTRPSTMQAAPICRSLQVVKSAVGRCEGQPPVGAGRLRSCRPTGRPRGAQGWPICWSTWRSRAPPASAARTPGGRRDCWTPSMSVRPLPAPSLHVLQVWTSVVKAGRSAGWIRQPRFCSGVPVLALGGGSRMAQSTARAGLYDDGQTAVRHHGRPQVETEW